MNLLPELKKILYCTEIGPNSAHIYRHAMALAEKFDGMITVLHVLGTMTPEQEASIDAYIGPDSIHEVIEHEGRHAVARVREHLNSFCARIGDEQGCRNRVERVAVVESLSPAEEIVRQADAMKADVIVMGAHGGASIMEALLGSTTDKVIRKSFVPVLVVRVPAGAQEPAAGM
ncbi:MAG: universal stress protein [Desulfobulbaceae bacterium]|jgi:nucleotide-binding universal stress UspA family protein|nr:universal stress protein [Desulfobulbaceae bacterium]MDY0352396.1 universal stress protein [Desulfobulbaceae bacterium]